MNQNALKRLAELERKAKPKPTKEMKTFLNCYRDLITGKSLDGYPQSMVDEARDMRTKLWGEV